MSLDLPALTKDHRMAAVLAMFPHSQGTLLWDAFVEKGDLSYSPACERVARAIAQAELTSRLQPQAFTYRITRPDPSGWRKPIDADALLDWLKCSWSDETDPVAKAVLGRLLETAGYRWGNFEP